MREKFGKWEYFEKFNVLYWWKEISAGRIWTQWIYLIVPFVSSALILVLMELDGVLLSEKDSFSFLRDTSNSLCMIMLFILSYYLGSIYSVYIKAGVDSIQKYQTTSVDIEKLNRVTKFVHCMILISLFGVMAQFPFTYIARNQGLGWMTHISSITNIVYGIYLGLVWYFSLCLLMYVLAGCYLFKKILSSTSFHLSWTSDCSPKKDLQEVAKCISFTISYATFWVFGAIVVIFNDFINLKYGVDMTFHKYPIATILLILFMIMGFSYVALPALEYRNVVIREKERRLKELEVRSSTMKSEELAQEIKEVEDISCSIFATSRSKATLLLSVLLPALTTVVQIVAEIVKNIW